MLKIQNNNDKSYLYRRLCPDISFFQQGTDYPCQKIVSASGQQRLHNRVQHTVLKSANVERKGLGVTKVTMNSRQLRFLLFLQSVLIALYLSLLLR